MHVIKMFKDRSRARVSNSDPSDEPVCLWCKPYNKDCAPGRICYFWPVISKLGWINIHKRRALRPMDLYLRSEGYAFVKHARN